MPEPAISTQRIVIIGGGIGGLACAWRLAQRAPGAQITVLDAQPHLGGALRTRRDADGLVLELGPDSILRSKPAAVALIRELGIGDQLEETDPAARSSLIARGARLLPVPEGLYLMAPGRLWPFLWSRLISWRGKLRMMKDLIIPTGTGDDETLGAFVRRRLGSEALDRLAQPLISGIYTADPERLSIQATMPQFLQMEQEHGSLLLAMRKRMRDQHTAGASGPRYGLFVSLRGGLQTLIDTLIARLTTAGVTLRAATTATGIERTPDGQWTIDIADEPPIHADAVVIAGPAWAAGALLRDVDTELSAQCASIAYAGVATINLVYNRDQIPVLPAAAGFVVPAIEGRSLVACTFSSRKYAGRTPEGRVCLRAFVGGALHAHHLLRDDAAMLAAVLDDLREVLRITAQPLEAVITRWPKAMAQYHLGHLSRVAAIRTGEAKYPGLALVGNGYEGVGIPDVIAQAEAAASRVLGAAKADTDFASH